MRPQRTIFAMATCFLVALVWGLFVAPPELAHAAVVNSIQSPDTGGDVGQYTSLQLDASGNPVVSYFDATNSNLKLLHCGNATCSSGNSIQTADNSSDVMGFPTSMVLDTSGNPVIAYTTLSGLTVVHCGDANCSADTITNVDSDGRSGSIRLDSAGYPVVAYYDSSGQNLSLLHCGDANCTSGNSFQSPDSAGNVGEFAALGLDVLGNPAMAYYDATNGDLKILSCANASCSAVNGSASPDTAGDVGQYVSGVLVPPSGAVSYYDATNDTLKIFHCTPTSYATCVGTATIVTADRDGEVGRYTSLALDGAVNPVVSYWDVLNGDLKVLHCGNSSCTAGNITTSPDTVGNVGLYTSLALDATGNPVVSYYDATNNDLKVLHCGDAICSPPCPILDQALPNSGCTEYATNASLTVSAPLLSGSPLACSAIGVASTTHSSLADHAPANGLDDILVDIYFISGYIDCPGSYGSGSSIPSGGKIEEQTNLLPGVLEFPATGDFVLCLKVYTTTILGTIENCPVSFATPTMKQPLNLHCVFLSLNSASCVFVGTSRFYDDSVQKVERAQVTEGGIELRALDQQQAPVGGVGFSPQTPAASGSRAGLLAALGVGAVLLALAGGALLARRRGV